jgi:hypothetical protein
LLVLQHALREITRQAREHLRIDLDPLALHRRQHWRQWPLQRFVHGDQPLACEFGLQFLVEPQRRIRLFARIDRGAVDRDLVEADLRLAAADEIAERHEPVAEMLLDEIGLLM